MKKPRPAASGSVVEPAAASIAALIDVEQMIVSPWTVTIKGLPLVP